MLTKYYLHYSRVTVKYNRCPQALGRIERAAFHSILTRTYICNLSIIMSGGPTAGVSLFSSVFNACKRIFIDQASGVRGSNVY